ncbi:hypothetical protein PM10SUCC1_29050 [Propionigenium maris DSM 9537]|uniref:CBM2 domain-containing protein n=1 Tax=Propionigenium maris DSM 9537 TaxID=1123000 RepID=A0A9W6LNI4_9FUSO|nr:cellulose binding domain-containing protein [Propionigenium maris]GLI57391.1 hypothetical protein PM10SUCC1_29050 [Propionigenium maris DSM 9537]
MKIHESISEIESKLDSLIKKFDLIRTVKVEEKYQKELDIVKGKIEKLIRMSQELSLDSTIDSFLQWEANFYEIRDIIFCLECPIESEETAKRMPVIEEVLLNHDTAQKRFEVSTVKYQDPDRAVTGIVYKLRKNGEVIETKYTKVISETVAFASIAESGHYQVEGEYTADLQVGSEPIKVIRHLSNIVKAQEETVERDIEVNINIANRYSDFGGTVFVTNKSGEAINGWTLEFESDFRVVSAYSSNYSFTNSKHVFKNASWNGNLGSINFGFNGSPINREDTIKNCFLNGKPCLLKVNGKVVDDVGEILPKEKPIIEEVVLSHNSNTKRFIVSTVRYQDPDKAITGITYKLKKNGEIVEVKYTGLLSEAISFSALSEPGNNYLVEGEYTVDLLGGGQDLQFINHNSNTVKVQGEEEVRERPTIEGVDCHVDNSSREVTAYCYLSDPDSAVTKLTYKLYNINGSLVELKEVEAWEASIKFNPVEEPGDYYVEVEAEYSLNDGNLYPPLWKRSATFNVKFSVEYLQLDYTAEKTLEVQPLNIFGTEKIQTITYTLKNCSGEVETKTSTEYDKAVFFNPRHNDFYYAEASFRLIDGEVVTTFSNGVKVI